MPNSENDTAAPSPNAPPEISNETNSEIAFPVRIIQLEDPPMEGQDVLQLQAALVKANISVKVDGVFGEETEKAVKEFQQQKALQADGIVGNSTRIALGLPLGSLP